MKTIILCGGKGMRLHQETEFKPKPMVKIGPYPMVVHIMKIYQHYGFNDFILPLGYKGELIREYFLNLRKFTDDFSFNMKSGETSYLTANNSLPFQITFVDTGENSLSGLRVKQAAEYIAGDEFMVTYGDGVSNVNIPALIHFHHERRAKHNTLVTITAAHPSSKYGQVIGDEENIIQVFDEKPVLNDYVNGGFMVFHREALSYFDGDEMLETVLQRMVKDHKVAQFRHEGFWHSMDTMKDVMDLNAYWEKGAPWKLD